MKEGKGRKTRLWGESKLEGYNDRTQVNQNYQKGRKAVRQTDKQVNTKAGR